MRKTAGNRVIIISLIIGFILVTFNVAAAQNGDGIQILSTEIENDFPNSLTFHISVQSNIPIERIKLYFKTQGSISTQSQPVDFEPSTTVNAYHTWDTSGFTTAPSTPINYYWQVTDQDGNKLKTPETLIYYDDINFDWQELSSPEIILRWYEGDIEFGNNIFNIANQALTQMKKETNRTLDFPVIILLYANEEDFSSWHYYFHDWVGGLAFPPLGVTAQIIPPTSNQFWIEDVIPHEIAHLFFYQIINADIYFWPTWLDEGLAQYYEFFPNDAALERVSQAARDGDLLPLVLISGDFGSDPDRAYLAYDQSYAVVFYMIETWGFEGLQKLTTNFHDGKGYREAIQGAFNISWEEFEAGWITWLGTPATPAPTPTYTPTYVFLSTPQSWSTPIPEQSIEVEPGSIKQTETDFPKMSATPAVPTPAKPFPLLSKTISLTTIYIGGVLGLLFLIAIIVYFYRRSKTLGE